MSVSVLFVSVLVPLVLLWMCVWTQGSPVGLCSTYKPPCIDDSGIQYRPLPQTPDYQVADYQDSEMTSWALGPFVTMARDLVVKYNTIDWGYLVGLAMGDIELQIPDTILDLAKMEMLLAGGTVFGLLLAVLLLLAGIFTCFCRCCCNTCGAKLTMNDAYKQSKTVCVICAGLLFFTCIILTVGVGAIYTVGERVPSTPVFTAQSIAYALSDVTLFKDYIFDQLIQVTGEDANFTLQAISYKIEHMSEEVTGPFMTSTQPMLDQLFTDLRSLESELTAASTTLGSTSTTITTVQSLATTLQTEITSLGVVLDDAVTHCTGDVILNAIPGLCSGLPTSGIIDPVPDLSTLPSTSDLQTMLDDALTTDFDGIISTATTMFDGLPGIVDVAAASVLSDARSAIDLIEGEITSDMSAMVTELETDVDGMFVQVTDLKYMFLNYTDMATPYLPYVHYAFMGLGAPVGFVLLTALLGCLCGSFSYKSDPIRRQQVNCCSSCCLVSSSALSVFVGFLYLLIGSILFFIGGNLSLVCEGLVDYTIFSQLVDNPEMWNDTYMISGMLFGDPTYNFTIESALRACEADSAVYPALHLHKMFDVAGLISDIDIESLLPDMSGMDDIVNATMDGIILVDPATQTLITDLLATPALDFSTAQDLLSDGLDLPGLISDLKTDVWDLYNVLQSTPGAGTLASMYQNIHDFDLTAIETGTLDSLADNMITLSGHLDTLESDFNSLLTSVADVSSSITDLDDYILGPGKAQFLLSVTGFVDGIVGIVTGVMDYILDVIETELGRCGVVHDVYMAFINTVCYYFLDAFNGFWLALCMCGFFCALNFGLSLGFTRYTRSVNGRRVNGYPDY